LLFAEPRFHLFSFALGQRKNVDPKNCAFLHLLCICALVTRPLPQPLQRKMAASILSSVSTVASAVLPDLDHLRMEDYDNVCVGIRITYL